ncbi:MAG: hypothetical protein J7549_03495 [Variovorax sp.]|nr:hypothetical protein [Variovorax sp.]
MDRRRFSLSVVGAGVLGGCGGGGEKSSGFALPPVSAAPPAAAPAPAPAPEAPAPAPVPPPVPELATPTSLPAGTMFLQTITATDGNRSVAPGQANIWDLGEDFSIVDGGDDQFDGTLQLYVGVAGTRSAFPPNQTWAELTALGPEMGPADGIKAVSFTTDPAFFNTTGRYAYLHAGVEVRLQQTLNLTNAIGPAISLTWRGVPGPGFVGTSLSDPAQYGQVVLRDTAGALLATLFRSDRSGTSGAWGLASLAAFIGQTVVLSFEQRLSGNSPNWNGLPSGSAIDDVSVKDSANTEFVVNGDFEAEGTGWTIVASKASQNVRTGTRTVNGLEVQRTFYTQPNLLWARLTDVFHNPTAAPIVAEVSYETNLGSDAYGIIYPTPGVATQKALTAWDYKSNGGVVGDRDIGFAFGTADLVDYRSNTALGARDGSDRLLFKFNITVPASGSVTLVNFVVMSGTDTGLTAMDITARATEVDTQLADIANNFRTNMVYQRGLTQPQLDTLKNF